VLHLRLLRRPARRPADSARLAEASTRGQRRKETLREPTQGRTGASAYVCPPGAGTPGAALAHIRGAEIECCGCGHANPCKPAQRMRTFSGQCKP
jgi:hypothetical protein